MSQQSGGAWRPSTLAHLRRVEVLERPNGEIVGSIGPGRRGQWINRDTGEPFPTIGEAKASVEKYL